MKQYFGRNEVSLDRARAAWIMVTQGLWDKRVLQDAADVALLSPPPIDILHESRSMLSFHGMCT